MGLNLFNRIFGHYKVKSCMHYEPAIIYEKDKPITASDNKNVPAYSKLKKAGMNTYACQECGLTVTKAQKKHIDEIVEYLNSGGDDDKVLSKFYKRIITGEMVRIGNEDMITEGAGHSSEFVPPKNVKKYK